MTDLILQRTADLAERLADDYWDTTRLEADGRALGLVQQCASDDSTWQVARDLLLRNNRGDDPVNALRVFAAGLRKIAEGEKTDG